MPWHKSKVYDLMLRHKIHQDPLLICPQPLLVQVVIPSPVQGIVFTFAEHCGVPISLPNALSRAQLLHTLNITPTLVSSTSLIRVYFLSPSRL